MFDSSYLNYYNLLIDHPSKLSIFVAYGYRQNKYVYSIANQEFYVYFYALDLANQELNENGFVIIDYIYSFLYNMDKHFLFFTGPR